jgi:Na+/melibiose symporter-like transporter
VVGLALAALVVFLTERNAAALTRVSYQRMVLIAILPGLLAPLLVWWKVKETSAARAAERKTSRQPLSGRFKLFLAIMVLFTLGHFSDAFLILRANELGLSPFYILLVLVMFNVVYAVTSLPAGVLSDRLGRRAVLLGGFAVYALIYLGFARATAPWQVVLLYIVYGLSPMGLPKGWAGHTLRTSCPREAARRPTASTTRRWAWLLSRQA